MSTRPGQPLTLHFELRDLGQRRAVKSAARALGCRVVREKNSTCFAVIVESVDDVYRLGQATATAMKGRGDREHDR